jgi:hypothetical protein
MFDGRVVRDKVDDYAQAAVMSRVGKSHKVSESTKPRIDAIKISYIVSVVAVRRWVKRQKPDASAAERLDVIESVG